jgi:hypothetical protein
MISHPDDKLGASSAHAKVNATHEWLVDPVNKAALANINVTAAALGIALAISRVISPKATDQQVERTGHGAILDGGLA